MTKPLRALLVEDSEDDVQLIVRALTQGGFDVTSMRVQTPAAMQGALRNGAWEVVLSDYVMPQFSGPAALECLKSTGLDVPFLIVSGKVGEEKAVELMRAGARDYVVKDNLSRLAPAIERELHEAQGRRERRQLEEQYRQAQKMEALGQLAGGVAHDFNNLITVISGFSEILLTSLGPSDPARTFVEQIKKAGERSAALARQLLLFSRKHAVSLQPVDLNVITGEAEKMLSRTIGETVKLVTDLCARPRLILNDSGQMEQVLFNLVINARDAMPHGGQITIRTRNMTFEEGFSRPFPDMPYGSYVVLEVADTGTGMAPEVLAHVFEPFFTTKSAGKGTGLGLATVFGIVKQSGGRIAVESQPGVGTTFRIYFPEAARLPAPANDQPLAAVAVPARAHEVVLLAEDELEVRLLINQILIRSGYTVLEAKNGKEALNLALKYNAPIAILVTDVVMPEMGGFELALQLRHIHPETKVLFTSGHPSQPGLRQEIHSGEVEFLPKPLSPAGLTCKIREILDSALPATATATTTPVSAGVDRG